MIHLYDRPGDPIPDEFYLVYMDQNTPPTIAHPSLLSAQEQFNRIMHNRAPGMRGWILKTIQMQVNPVPTMRWQWVIKHKISNALVALAGHYTRSEIDTFAGEYYDVVGRVEGTRREDVS